MSRQYRNTAQWLELIEAFECSGQTQVEFCAELKLNPKYFSKRRSELLNAHSGPAFVQIQTQSMSTPAVDSGASSRLIHQTKPRTKKASGLSFKISMFRKSLIKEGHSPWVKS